MSSSTPAKQLLLPTPDSPEQTSRVISNYRYRKSTIVAQGGITLMMLLMYNALLVLTAPSEWSYWLFAIPVNGFACVFVYVTAWWLPIRRFRRYNQRGYIAVIDRPEIIKYLAEAQRAIVNAAQAERDKLWPTAIAMSLSGATQDTIDTELARLRKGFCG